MNNEPAYTRRAVITSLGAVGITAGLGSVTSAQSNNGSTDKLRQWHADTGLNEIATAATISGQSIIIVGNRLPEGSLDNPESGAHAKQEFFLVDIDITTCESTVTLVTPPEDTGRDGLTITGVAAKGTSVAVVGHQHRTDQIVGMRIDQSGSVSQTWRTDVAGLTTRARIYWQNDQLVQVWRWESSNALGTGVDVRNPDGTQVATDQLGGSSWHCQNFATSDAVYVTRRAETPQIGLIEPETATIDWQGQLRSCYATPTPSGEIGIETTESTLSWYFEPDQGTSSQGQFASDIKDHEYLFETAMTADGAYLMASGQPSDGAFAETHLLRVSSDGLDWHSRLAADDRHLAARALTTTDDDRWVLVGTTGSDDLDAWILSGFDEPTSLPEPRIVPTASNQQTHSTEKATTTTKLDGSSSGSPTPVTEPTPTETPPMSSVVSTSSSSPTTANTATSPGQSGALFSDGGIVGLLGVLVGGVYYIQRKQQSQE